ncbi:DUF4097 family beta strand repeat protein [Nonomuraea sp. K274]|uniref:DUF4097 family beta strand repeat protein n=2 Tax=Nonomuraea cypriaca TaxID=1187855 RepID=A0A931A5D0_9ACTN|nr:DUF4097 family beta strand repeat protein [Nonomuraea cypriaca]
MPAFDTPEPISVIIDVAAANIRINASDRTDTVVEIRPSDEFDDTSVQMAEEAQVYYAGGRLLVKADKRPAASMSGWGSLDKLVEAPAQWLRSLVASGSSVDVTIDLPAGSRVDATTGASLRCRGSLDELRFTTSYGDIRVEQAGRMRLSSTHGDISVTRAAGHAEVTNTHGDIRIGEMRGTTLVKTSHGQITLGEVAGELRLNSAYGDITVDRALSGVAAKTAYGSLRIGEAVSGSVVMETTGGGLELGIPGGTPAWLDVSSQHGTVDVALDAGDGPAQSERTVEVRAHTTYGDIIIHRS